MSTAPAAPASPPSPAVPPPGGAPAGAEDSGDTGGAPADTGTAVAPAWIRRALLVNLVAQIGIVVTGGMVRVTGSGLGCPTWPECVPGSFTPVEHQAEGYTKYIEFGNRTLTSVVVLTAIAALAAGLVHRAHLRRAGTGTGRRWAALSVAPIVLVLVQAVVGGLSVLFDLAPAFVAVHFLGSIALIVVSGLLYLATGAAVPPNRRPELRWITGGLAVLALVVLVLGTVVTGSGPHSGDEDTPSRFGFNPRDVAWLHADVVMLFVGLVVALVLVARLSGAGPALRRRTLWLLGVTLAQGVIGYVQYLTDLPIVLVVLHMLGAALLTLAVTAVGAGVIGSQGVTGTQDVDGTRGEVRPVPAPG